MSRTFMVGILAILVCLMGVVSYLMTPKPPPPPKPPDPARMKQMQESEMKSRQEMMKRQMAATKGAEPRKPGKPPKPGSPPPGGGGMDITGDWFRKRQPGQEGLHELETKAAEAARQAPVMSQQTAAPPPGAK